ncbi:MAG: DUF397 domain-containing protein [Pseudonocardia sp.]
MPRWNEWFTPRQSARQGNCVETLLTPDAVHVRNSKRPDETTVTFTHDEWRAFIDSVRESDDYDLPAVTGPVAATSTTGTAGAPTR